MQKYKAKKEVVEEIAQKLKEDKNKDLSLEFAEKLQIQGVNSGNNGKLEENFPNQNKNIFARGDFDEHKIKNMGVAPDGCVYDLDNPTEKFYYDLKMQFAEIDKTDNFEKSLTISDKLFRLWQRRLSPELQNEMLKLMDDKRDYFYLIPKKVYEVEGYPKGQDLENCELMEFADTYFIIACGGDWQDEKLVKFEIGNNDKLFASVVKNCEKEDKRVLNKKVAYIINPETINKSLTYSGYKLQGRTKLYGMDISIENKKGSYRSGVDSDGHKWKCFMNYDYGYIRGTEGVDGDHVDCYIGPAKDSNKVYVIHQNNPVTHKYDEDKCMLCFESADAAKKAYMKQYDRPGFFGSMDILTVDEFKGYVFSKQGKRIHKSFDIVVTDITENNKQLKLEQVAKSLSALSQNKSFVINHIPSDSSKKYGNLTLRISDFDKNKIEKAIHKMAMTLDTDIKATSIGEAFIFKSQEDLTNQFVKEFTQKTNSVYQFVIDYFDLPEIRIVSKSNLKYKGKVIYNPETGEPITKKDWKEFVDALEKFLNRNYNGMGEKIVLTSETLGILLERISKNQSMNVLKKMPLSEMGYKNKKFDWISKTASNMKDVFGETVSRNRAARIQVAIDSAAVRVTKVTDSMRNDIQQIIIDGIKNKSSKSQISQNLFDKCVGLNRDFQKIADTEIQNNVNNAYVKEEVYQSKEGEKVYFRRFEILDDNTCSKCKKIKDKIALWSDVALPNENIDDVFAKYAIWEGKENGDMPIGCLHPFCRGSWFRYYPDIK